MPGREGEPIDNERLKPEVVREAEQTIQRFGMGVGAAAVGVVLAYLTMMIVIGPLLPASWWTMALAAVIGSFFFPPTRKAQRARELLRQWDDISSRTALEASGAATDPHLQVAEAMGDRVLRHPALAPDAGRAVAQLLDRLRQATRDQRTLQIMSRTASGPQRVVPGPRTLSDLDDYLEARIGRLLGALAEIHSAVVERDADEVERVLGDAHDILAEVEASNEVSRILGDGSS